MKTFCLLFVSLFIFSCQEKTFADDITLVYPKNTKMKIQEFNECIGESGSGIIYIGKEKKDIPLKYLESMIPAPPPPPSFEKTEIDSTKEKIFRDFFYSDSKIIKSIGKPVKFDSLTNKDIQIVVKNKDIIPKYAYNFETNQLKKYKAFPVFIKNISGRNLRLPELKNLPFAFLNKNKKWQIIWNDNAFICGDSRWNYHYWDFKPNDIIIMAVNYFDGKETGRFKVEFFDQTSSIPFEMNYNKELIKDQRKYLEVK